MDTSEHITAIIIGIVLLVLMVMLMEMRRV